MHTPDQSVQGNGQKNPLLVRNRTMVVQNVASNYILIVLLCHAKDTAL